MSPPRWIIYLSGFFLNWTYYFDILEDYCIKTDKLKEPFTLHYLGGCGLPYLLACCWILVTITREDMTRKDWCKTVIVSKGYDNLYRHAENTYSQNGLLCDDNDHRLLFFHQLYRNEPIIAADHNAQQIVIRNRYLLLE